MQSNFNITDIYNIDIRYILNQSDKYLLIIFQFV